MNRHWAREGYFKLGRIVRYCYVKLDFTQRVWKDTTREGKSDVAYVHKK